MDYADKKRECRAFGRCGACQTLNLTYNEELSLKMKKCITLLGRFGHVEEIFSMDRPMHYRNKVQYLFSFRRGRTCFGLYRSSDGGIVPVSACMMEDEELSAVCRTVKKLTDQYGLKVYDGRRGLIRHVMARKAFSNGEMLCAIVTSKEKFPRAKEFARELAEKHDKLRSVSVIQNDTDIPLWMGGEETVLYGEGYITDRLCGCDFRVSAKSFYQINPIQTEKLYALASEYAAVTLEDRVLDAYCGIGTIGIVATKNGCRSLTAFDVNGDAVADAKINAELNGIKNSAFLRAKDASFVLNAEEPFDVVFVDPPRAGCDKKFLQLLIENKPRRLVYISCNPETLARDLHLLQKEYKIKKIQPVDMFPGTTHVETVTLLSRKDVHERIKFDVNVEELQGRASSTATYSEIKAYILEKYGLNVTSLNIAQVKEKHGFEKRENYNKGKDGHRVPNCPPEKEKAIEDAFKHFGML